MKEDVDLREGFYLDEWHVDPQTGRLSREYQTIALEPKIMDVLVLLADSYPSVVKKEEFLKAVWPDVNVVGHVLTRAISEIRRVFNDDPKNPHVIETIPKIGYRLLMPIRLEPPQDRPEVFETAESTGVRPYYRHAAAVSMIGAAAFGMLIVLGFVAMVVLRGGIHAH